MSIARFTITKLNNTDKRGILPVGPDGYYEMVVGGLNIYNSHGDFYTLEGARTLFESSSIFMRRVTNGCLKAELGHPRREPHMTSADYLRRLHDIDPKNVCAHYAEIWLDTDFGKNNPSINTPNAVGIMAKLKPAGPHSKVLQDAIDDPHQNLCFSIRGITDDYRQNGQIIRVLKTLITIDYVIEPGIKFANKYDSPSLESLDYPISPVELEAINASSTNTAIEELDLIKESIDVLTPKKTTPIYSKW